MAVLFGVARAGAATGVVAATDACTLGPGLRLGATAILPAGAMGAGGSDTARAKPTEGAGAAEREIGGTPIDSDLTDCPGPSHCLAQATSSALGAGACGSAGTPAVALPLGCREAAAASATLGATLGASWPDRLIRPAGPPAAGAPAIFVPGCWPGGGAFVSARGAALGLGAPTVPSE